MASTPVRALIRCISAFVNKTQSVGQIVAEIWQNQTQRLWSTHAGWATLASVKSPVNSDVDIKAVFGANVRTVRLFKRVTQEQLAELTGLHPNYVGSVERGERNISIVNIQKFVDGLGVDAGTLFATQTEPRNGRVKATRRSR